MNPANINDPTAVRALLDQLRASQVWQDTLNSTSSRVGPEHHASVREPTGTPEDMRGDPRVSGAIPPASVASLLSQLRTSEWAESNAINTPPVSNARAAHDSSQDTPLEPSPTPSEHRPPRPVAAKPSTSVHDTRYMSFQQALPHLTRLASDPGLLTTVSRLRQEQNELEEHLWEERQAIHKKHEEKVKVARTKAAMIGTGLSKHEADMMNDAYRRDLERFDRERVLVAWDALLQRQQAGLEALGVPAMFRTTSEAECQKQRRIVQVLEGL